MCFNGTLNKIKNGNGECVKETTTWPKTEKTDAGYQWVFNTARKSHTPGGISPEP